MTLAILLAAALPAPPLAAPPPAARGDAFDRCINGNDRSVTGVSATLTCLGTAVAIQEERRSTAYAHALTLGTVRQQLRLRSDEEAWVAGLPGYCADHSGADRYGNLNVIAYERCLLDQNAARAAMLEAYVPPEVEQ